MAKKKSKFKYPKLGLEKFNQLQECSTDELHEEMFKAKRAEDVLKKKKKDDPKLNELKEKIQTFIDEHMPDDLLKEIARIAADKKQTLKEIKDMNGIKDSVMDLKIESKEHNDDIAVQTQKQKAILEIIRKRENS